MACLVGHVIRGSAMNIKVPYYKDLSFDVKF